MREDENLDPSVPERLTELREFLAGKGVIDGAWFGEFKPGERVPFWWRKRMRADLTEALTLLDTQAAEIERLKAGWQPIETAPRDGTRILACGGGLTGPDVVSYNILVGAWDCIDAVLDDRDDEGDGYNRPTHWMPLPVPPSDEVKS